MTRRTLIPGILASALALGPGPAAAQTRAAGDMVTANGLYSAQRYAEAAAAYQAVVDADPTFGEAHFFLANSLENLYRPARRGEPANDRLLEAARDHYVTAADLLGRADQAVVLTRTLQFLAAIYARDKLNRPDQAEPVVRRLIALDPRESGGYFALAKIYEDAGRLHEAAAIWEEVQRVAPDRTEVWTASAQFYNRQGDFDRTMEMLHQVTEIEPANPQAFYQLAVFYEEKVRKDFTTGRARQTEYLAQGLEAIDRALALRPDYFEALTYKNLILRQQARLEADPVLQRGLIDEADRLQQQAIDVRNAQTGRGRRP